jgi:predicted chitinase
MVDFIPVGKNGILGKISFAKDKSAPLVICFGGIDVAGRRSGVYMYDYFNESILSKFHVFVSYSHATNGAQSYSAIKKILEESKIKPSYYLLYLFSGGYRPGIEIVDTVGLDFFKKVYLVDIYIGKTLYWVNLAEKQPTKFVYFWTPGAHANVEAHERIKKKVENFSGSNHLDTNIDAVNYLNKNNNEPWPVDNTPVLPVVAINKSTKGIIGDFIATLISQEYKDIIPIPEISGQSITTVDSLKSKLTSMNPMLDFNKIILSIGSEDSWSLSSSAGSTNTGASNLSNNDLVLQIRRVFPNAEFYIINGTSGWEKLSSTSSCSNECWSKKIDAYISFFTEKKFQTIGQKKVISSRPKTGDLMIKDLSADLSKYGFIQASETVQNNPTQPQGQETSRGDLAGSGEEQKQDSQKNQLTTKGIENIFPATIKPSQIQIPAPLSEAQKKEFVRGMGFLPVIWYNNYQIDVDNVVSFSIYYNDILPSLSMTFYDTLGIMKDTASPVDNTKITIFINSRSEKLRPVHLQFKITNFSNKDRLMNIQASIDVDALYIKQYKGYKESTSNKVLQDIAKEVGIGFNTNVVETGDKMNWINTGLRNYEFMMEVLENAYISDESFVSGNLDLFYNFNFIDVQKELSRDINGELAVSSNGLLDVFGLPAIEDTAPLLLSSDESLKGSNNYFSTYKILNRATDVALDKGYSDDFIYYDTDSKKAPNFELHSMTLNEGSSLVLKGGRDDDAFFASNKNYVYAGKTIADNTHQNFNYSKTHNERNIFEAEKLAAEIELPFPNFNIYRFQKVRILFSHNASTLSSPAFNARYSGDWLVIDIRYVLFDGKFKQIITLIRRELSLTQEEIDSGVPIKNRPEGRGNFINPAPTPQPNSGGTSNTTNTNPLLPRPVNPQPSPSSSTEPKAVSRNVAANLAEIEKALREVGIVNINIIKAVKANVIKECEGVPKVENLGGYCGTSISRVRSIFTKRVSGFSDQELTVIKCNERQFADVIYGAKSGMGLGNDLPGDGYKYRGRGFIQITGKAIYAEASKTIYKDNRLVTNPDTLVTDVQVSARVTAWFIRRGLYSMASKLGLSVNSVNQEQSNQLITSVIAGQPIRRGGSGYLNQLVAKVDNIVIQNFA